MQDYQTLTRIQYKNERLKLLSNEFLLVTIFMLGFVNGLIGEIALLYGTKAPTNLIYFILYLLSLIVWCRSLLSSFNFSLLVLIIALSSIGLSCLINDKVCDVIFNFEKGSLSGIGQSNFAVLFGLCLPLLILCVQKMEIYRIYKYLKIYSVILSLLFIITMIFQVFFFLRTINYMTIAYSVLPAIFILYYDGKTNKKVLSNILFWMSFIGLLIGGCRGAILTAIVLIFLWGLRDYSKQTTGKRVLFLFIIPLIAILIISNLTQIVIWLDNFFKSFGYSSRLFSKFLNLSADGDILYFTDREIIYDMIKSKIGFFGKGVFGDRAITTTGQYTHNFVLEVLVQFGYFFGIALLVLFIYYLVKSYKAANKFSKLYQNDFLTFCWYCLLVIVGVKLMVSSSYLIDRTFWMFLGMSAIALCYKKDERMLQCLKN